MTALTIARTSLKRYLRDRTAMFFVVALPILVIVLVGATARGFDTLRVGVVATIEGPLAADLLEALEESPALEVVHFETRSEAATAARRGEVVVAVIVPDAYDDTLVSGSDQTVTILADQTDTNQQAAASAVASVVAEQAGLVQAARFATAHADGDLGVNVAMARDIGRDAASVAVTMRIIDTERRYLPEGFSYSAPTMLVLFVFVNSLAGGAAIIENRRLRMYERMSAAPVSTAAIVTGETLCYLAMALLQSILIVSVGAFAFGVRWGDPIAAAALVTVWALVGTGAGVLSGTVFKTPEQASSIGPSIGIAFGMLGGCMWPLEIVPAAMQAVGHIVPHGWAVDAWITLLSRGGHLGDIAVALLVLAGFAVALLGLATRRLRQAVSA